MTQKPQQPRSKAARKQQTQRGADSGDDSSAIVLDSRVIVLDRKRLLSYRTNLGWSQAMLAEKAGLSEDTVSRAENGKPIRLGLANVIAMTYEISLKDLSQPNAEKPKDQQRIKRIFSGDPYYNLYSNGMLVQKLDVEIPPGADTLFIVYPLTFPNEVINVQVVGIEAATKQVTLSNCRLVFSPALEARKINLIFSGI